MTTNIEQRVMASVAARYVARRLTSVRALSGTVALASPLALWKFVWVHRVLEHFASAQSRGIDTLGNYIVTALSHAHVPVQIALLCAIAAAGFLVADIIRSSSRGRSLAF